MRTDKELNNSYEATRELVIAKEKETGIYVDGFYQDARFELSKSGKAYKIQHEDHYLYVAVSAVITDGNGCLFIPFPAIDSAIKFAERNDINEYIGG